MKTLNKIRFFFFRLLFGIDLNSFYKKEEVNTLNIQGSGLNDNYLFDFLNYASQYNNNFPSPQDVTVMITDQSSPAAVPKKIAIKPIDVLQELELVPTPFTLTLLDEKIEMLKEKEKLIIQHYSKREVGALIERLENRKRYNEFKDFFDSFQNTTTEKIGILTTKYDLVMRTSDLFVPEFPKAAIDIMALYTEKMNELCGKKPVFYVIATSENFQEKYKRRDPILLVQSPFAFYWQILGAWDKEMIMLSEL